MIYPPRAKSGGGCPEPADCVDLECEPCGEAFTLGYRRAADRKGKPVLCHDCLYPALTAPTYLARSLVVRKLEAEARETALAGLAALR